MATTIVTLQSKLELYVPTKIGQTELHDAFRIVAVEWCRRLSCQFGGSTMVESFGIDDRGVEERGFILTAYIGTAQVHAAKSLADDFRQTLIHLHRQTSALTVLDEIATLELAE